MSAEVYRPAVIEFSVAHDGSNMPESFGKFETPEESGKFIGAKLTALNQPLTTIRYLDNKEKKDLQEKYSDLLENIVPIYEKHLMEADLALTNAKKALKEAEERYNAEIAKVKELAVQKKRGVTDINLDEKYTYRIPYQGKYYYYTWMDKELKLAAIRTIPEYEKQDLFNAMAGNEEFINKVEPATTPSKKK